MNQVGFRLLTRTHLSDPSTDLDNVNPEKLAQLF